MNEFKIKALICQLETETKEMKDPRYLVLALLQIQGLRSALQLNQEEMEKMHWGKASF